MAVWPVSAQMSLKLSAEDGAGATVGPDVVSIPMIIQYILDLSQDVWSSLTRRAGQVGNATDISGAALRQGVQERGARRVGAAATAVTATAATTAVTASSGDSNGERGHEGDEESGQLHFVGGKKTQRLKSNGVSVWQKTEDLLVDANDDDEEEKRTTDRGDDAFFYR